MNKYIQNLRYLLHHKWVVFLECRAEGLLWQGILHDISKFSRAEFKSYADYYFVAREKQQSLPEAVSLRYRYAWLHHVHNNKHHWQYWVVGHTSEALRMPERYLREMCCDWRAMSRGCQRSTRKYYLLKRQHMVLHPETREKIEHNLGIKPTDDSGSVAHSSPMPAGNHQGMVDSHKKVD